MTPFSELEVCPWQHFTFYVKVSATNLEKVVDARLTPVRAMLTQCQDMFSDFEY